MVENDDELLSAWAALLVSHALAVRSVGAQLKGKVPLSLDEYDILLVTSRSPEGRIRFASLAEATLFTRSGVTRVAKRLEARGFLSRKTCAEDKRGAFAVVTAEGRRALKETWRLYAKAIVGALRPCLSPTEAKQLAVLLEGLIGHFRGGELVQIGCAERAP